MKLKAIITVLLIQLYAAVGLQAETVHLSAASSMTDTLKEIITSFTAAHPDVHIRPNFGSSGSLAKQIEQGAPADVYISANPKWMQYLIKQRMIAPGTKRIFAYNRLIFIGEKRRAPISMNKLTGLNRIALGSPKNVPAGQYAKQAMEQAGVY
ncbi:MAG: molybdate ABC transporter substrate-binding protein, partial [Candidatus Electrothrix sp. AR5]|nr:molybdate ABC transporter substrate-binding protein [Candidatus Electrothrix sp. AR5]